MMRMVPYLLAAGFFAPVAMGTPTILAESERAEYSLAAEAVQVSVSLPESVVADPPRRLLLVVEGIRLIRPGGLYRVYLNLPAVQETSTNNPEGAESTHFLGHLSSFGRVVEDAPDGRRSFDITEQVLALSKDPRWDRELELTFLHGNPDSSYKGPEEHLRFSHIVVIERPDP